MDVLLFNSQDQDMKMENSDLQVFGPQYCGDPVVKCETGSNTQYVDDVSRLQRTVGQNKTSSFRPNLHCLSKTTSVEDESSIKFCVDSKDLYIDNLIESVNLADLSFCSYNDLSLDDCLCSDTSSVQKEDFSSGASFSFFSKPVQSLKDSEDTEILDFNTFLADDDSVGLPYHGVDGLAMDPNCDFYHVLDFLENTNNNEPIQKKEEGKQGKVSSSKGKSKTVKSQKAAKCPLKKGQRYLPSFKQKVLDYAANHTFKGTALKFNINVNTITEWSRESNRLLKQKSTTDMPGSVCNLKTDLINTPVSKTEHFLSNDEVSETEHKFTIDSWKVVDGELVPPSTLPPDVRFLQWVAHKRKGGCELTADMVHRVAGYCLHSSMHDRPPWFVSYIARLEKALHSSVSTGTEMEKYIMYPSHFKKEVVLYARVFTKNAAARVFNVPRKRTYDWYKQVTATPKHDEDVKCKIYKQLVVWYREQRAQCTKTTSHEIKEKAKAMFLANGITDVKFSEGWLSAFCKRTNIKLRYTGDDELLMWILAQFDKNISLSHQQITAKSCELGCTVAKGSKGRTLRFLKRHSNFLQQIPTISDHLPDVATARIDEFRKTVQLLASGCLGPANIGCMDEIPIRFDYPADDKTNSMPLLRKSGFDNCPAVVLLCVLGNGQVLPPAVVLKGEAGTCMTMAGDMPVMYRSNGQVDEEILLDWLDAVWFRYTTGPSVLIMDSYEPHGSTFIEQHLRRGNCTLAIIPDGCSSQLQPVSVGITRLFQEHIKSEWKQMTLNLVSGQSTSTGAVPGVSGKCHCPDGSTILSWVSSAHQQLEKHATSITNSFKLTRILI